MAARSAVFTSDEGATLTTGESATKAAWRFYLAVDSLEQLILHGGQEMRWFTLANLQRVDNIKLELIFHIENFLSLSA